MKVSEVRYWPPMIWLRAKAEMLFWFKMNAIMAIKIRRYPILAFSKGVPLSTEKVCPQP